MTTQTQAAEPPTLEGALTAARTVSGLMGGRLDTKAAEAAAALILAAAGSEGAALRSLTRAFPQALPHQEEAVEQTAQLLDQDEGFITVADPVSGDTNNLLGFVDFAVRLLRGELNAMTVMNGVNESAIGDTLKGSGWNPLSTAFLEADADPQDWLPMCQELPEGALVLPLGDGYAAAAAAVYNNQVLDLIYTETEAVNFDTPGAGAMLRRWAGMLSGPVHGLEDCYRTHMRHRVDEVLRDEDNDE